MSLSNLNAEYARIVQNFSSWLLLKVLGKIFTEAIMIGFRFVADLTSVCRLLSLVRCCPIWNVLQVKNSITPRANSAHNDKDAEHIHHDSLK